jgi:hypothetical protein
MQRVPNPKERGVFGSEDLMHMDIRNLIFFLKIKIIFVSLKKF